MLNRELRLDVKIARVRSLDDCRRTGMLLGISKFRVLLNTGRLLLMVPIPGVLGCALGVC